MKKVFENKKVFLTVIALVLCLGGLMGAGFYFHSASKRTPDYKKQYTQEEWGSLSKQEQQEIRDRRACEYAKPGYQDGVHDLITPLGIDCSKYQ